MKHRKSERTVLYDTVSETREVIVNSYYDTVSETVDIIVNCYITTVSETQEVIVICFFLILLVKHRRS